MAEVEAKAEAKVEVAKAWAVDEVGVLGEEEQRAEGKNQQFLKKREQSHHLSGEG